MVREKSLVVRGEIWTLFAIFMFIILFHYILMQWRHWSQESINLFQTSSNKYHTNNFVIIKQVHFILIKCNFYDHYFIYVCTFLKKIHVSGPRDSKLWVWWSVRSEWLATADLHYSLFKTPVPRDQVLWMYYLIHFFLAFWGGSFHCFEKFDSSDAVCQDALHFTNVEGSKMTDNKRCVLTHELMDETSLPCAMRQSRITS
jgi:hypothetical protein